MEEIEPHNTNFSEVRATDNAVISVTLTPTGDAEFESFELERFFNTQMRRNLRFLGMREINRRFFAPNPVGEVEHYGGVQILSGIQTAIAKHKVGLLLMVDTTSKFLRKQTVRDFLASMAREARQGFMAQARRELPGSIVMATYSSNTYKVDDIDFKRNPLSTFRRGDTEITYVDYYQQQYQLEITDTR